MRRLTCIGVLLLALAGSAALERGSAEAASVRTVRIQGIDFHPRTLTIARGSTVRWSFLDGDTPHNVTSRGAKRFRNSPTKTQGTFSVRFRHAGTYRYVCTIHFNMVGKIVVR